MYLFQLSSLAILIKLGNSFLNKFAAKSSNPIQSTRSSAYTPK